MPGWTHDAVLGCLLGGAIGDALGGIGERGRSSLSDDTQLTLATCEAVCEAGGFDPAALARAFVRWFRERRLSGLGSSTVKALRDLEAGAHWALAGARGERAAGNGGAMRIAPLAFLPTVDRAAVRDAVRVTHHSDEASLGAWAVVAAIRQAWAPTPAALLAQVAADLPDCRVRDQMQAVAALDPSTPLAGVASVSGTSGWVVETVPLALWAGWSMAERPFGEGIDALVEIGGDTDTIASIAGQLAGARRGLAGLPASLVSLVPERETIEDIGRRFCAVVCDERS